MARPRVFVSSTYYDLKHVRSALESFIESLGYEPILSEKGDIAFTPEVPLDESCYREVKNADILVLVVGGRYGSERSTAGKVPPKSFFERYESVTKLEYKSAVAQDIPIYVFVERQVYAEYQTYLRNKGRTDITYAHVDSANVFVLIEEILAQPRNNPVREFDRYEDIEIWLREQWAGLFRELLHRATASKQIATLQSQVSGVAEVANTLRVYLEEVVQKVAPAQGSKLVSDETARLEEALRQSKLLANRFVQWCTDLLEIPPEDVVHALVAATAFADLGEKLAGRLKGPEREHMLRNVVPQNTAAFRDANAARRQLGRPEFEDKPLGDQLELREARPERPARSRK